MGRAGMRRGGEDVALGRLVPAEQVERVAMHGDVPTGHGFADGGRLGRDVHHADPATGISRLLNRLGSEGIGFHDLKTSETSLEEIFVSLVKERA